MKSIATELVNEYKRLKLINFSRYDYSGFKVNAIDMSNIKVKAKAHALTCQTILEVYSENRKFMSPSGLDIVVWCESEIKILKEGGLI